MYIKNIFKYILVLYNNSRCFDENEISLFNKPGNLFGINKNKNYYFFNHLNLKIYKYYF